MMTAWWVWFLQGYAGVPQTLAALGAASFVVVLLLELGRKTDR